MRTEYEEYDRIEASIPDEFNAEVDLEMDLSDHINNLMNARGLSKAEFARAIGKRLCEITKWLSGQHNLTIKALAMLSNFFGESLIIVNKNCFMNHGNK